MGRMRLGNPDSLLHQKRLTIASGQRKFYDLKIFQIMIRFTESRSKRSNINKAVESPVKRQ